MLAPVAELAGPCRLQLDTFLALKVNSGGGWDRPRETPVPVASGVRNVAIRGRDLSPEANCPH